MSDENNHAMLLQKKLNYYLSEGKRIHITFKDKERKWKRGYIKYVGADFFLLWEDFENREIPIFYLELGLDGINEFTPPKTGGGK